MATEQILLNKILAAFGGLTGFYTVIQSDHRYIHMGLAHTAIIKTASISAPYYVGFTTPSVASGKYIHWRPAGLSTSANYIAYELFEGDTFTGGTDVTIENKNRNLDTTHPSVMQSFKAGVTSTPVGSLIQLAGIGTSGNPTARSGGGAGADQELVLIPNTNYVVKIAPAGATLVTLELFWYEENGYTGA